MGCGNCSSGSPAGCGSNGGCSTGGCNRLNVYDWLSDVPISFNEQSFNIVEVSFKNGARKGYYRNSDRFDLYRGDLVVVDTAQGYDIGEVSLTGVLVKLQMKKKKIKDKSDTVRKLIRVADENDIEIYKKAKARDHEGMIKARIISRELNLTMKIGDVEFQGDNKKATFYYIADTRVDFRDLVKRFAREFNVKIEMRQIGSRQEAGRIGGIGSCGRELCCSTWLTDFSSVTTSAARYQNLSINTEKLSGQCGRLKCCLNYELDTYMDALKVFPKKADSLKTKEGKAFLKKTEIFKQLMWFQYKESTVMHKLSVDDVNTIREMNANDQFPENLNDFSIVDEKEDEKVVEDLVGQISLQMLNERNKSRGRGKGKGGNKRRNKNYRRNKK